MDEKLCIPNDIPTQTLPSPPLELLHFSLEQILKTLPPEESYSDEQASGFFMGYTGLAFLLFQISALRPGLEILGHDLTYWAKRYMEGDREVVDCFTVDKEQGCGLLNEQLFPGSEGLCVQRAHRCARLP